MSNPNGVTRVDAVGLSAAELAAAPNAYYLVNPERWEFYLTDTPSLRFRIRNSVYEPVGLKGSLAVNALGSAVTPSGFLLSTLSKARAAYAGVIAKTQHMKVVLLSDSTGAGMYSLGSATAVTGNRPVSPTAFLAAAFGTPEAPAFDAAWCGDQNVVGTGGTVDAYDAGRIATFTAPWGSATSGNIQTIGGNSIFTPSGSGSFQFRPFEPCNRMELYYRIDTGLSTNFSISRSGDTTMTGISASGATAVGKAIFNGALDVQLFNVQRVSGGGGLHLLMADCYDTTTPSVRFFNATWSSGRCSDWKAAGTPYACLNMLLLLNPDLVIIQPGINEYHLAGDQTGSPSTTVGGQFPATYQADLEIIVTALLNAGISVMLSTHYPSQKTQATTLLQKVYANVTRAVATAHGLLLDDLFLRLGTWERVNPRTEGATGEMADALHPAQPLYRKRNEALAGLLRRVLEM